MTDENKNDSADAFDRHAKEYDAWFDSPEGRVLFHAELEAIRLLVKDLSKPFLEIGAGTGRFASELGIGFGIDPSVAALEIADRRGIQTIKARGEKLPFPEDTFGCVFILCTLCFVEYPPAVLSEAKRVLKTGGALIVGILNRESQWGRLYMQKKTEGHPIYKYARFFSAAEVAGLIEKAGMKIEAWSSALFQTPSQTPSPETARTGLFEDAGFICASARK